MKQFKIVLVHKPDVINIVNIETGEELPANPDDFAIGERVLEDAIEFRKVRMVDDNSMFIGNMAFKKATIKKYNRNY